VIKIAALGTSIFSCLGALSFNLESLIFFRTFNGTFGAGIFPVTMALIGESFEGSQRQNAIGKVMGMMFLGGATATVIGGALAYFGSWRLVYLVYGIAELIMSVLLLKALKPSQAVIDKLDFKKVYGQAISNKKLITVTSIIFFVGFSVFGSFTYSGKFVQSVTSYNILIVGLILSLFGIATVIGGRKAGAIRAKLGSKFLLLAGIIGGISLAVLSYSKAVLPIGIALFGFGLAFVFLQSTLVTTAQEMMPKLRGTAMSMASFNMFVGGGIGTTLNGKILGVYGISKVFLLAGVILFIVGIIASIAVNKINRQIA